VMLVCIFLNYMIIKLHSVLPLWLYIFAIFLDALSIGISCYLFLLASLYNRESGEMIKSWKSEVRRYLKKRKNRGKGITPVVQGAWDTHAGKVILARLKSRRPLTLYGSLWENKILR